MPKISCSLCLAMIAGYQRRLRLPVKTAPAELAETETEALVPGLSRRCQSDHGGKPLSCPTLVPVVAIDRGKLVWFRGVRPPAMAWHIGCSRDSHQLEPMAHKNKPTTWRIAMYRNRKSNKLSLNRETLRQLDHDNLVNVAGGFLIPIYNDTYGMRCLSKVPRLCTDSKVCTALC